MTQDKNTYPITITYSLHGEEQTVHMRSKVDFVTFGLAIESIVNALFAGGQYMPYLEPFVLASVVISNYTDYSGSYAPDHILELVDESDFYQKVTAAIDQKQSDRMRSALDELIAHKRASPASEEFFLQLQRLLTQWDERLSDAMQSKGPAAVAGELKQIRDELQSASDAK